MKKPLYIFLIIVIFTSCNKDERTKFLSQDQKDIIDVFSVGDKFTMLKNGTDTLIFEVTKASYAVASNGRWYENGGPETWTERGSVRFIDINEPMREFGTIKVSGEDNNTANMYFGGINPLQITKLDSIILNNTKYYNNVLLYYNSMERNAFDSACISINNGIIKVWDNEEDYLRIK
jgi:hypothetical protein